MKHPYATRELIIAGTTFKIQEVEDSGALFDSLIATGPDSDDFQDERIPYWAELWPSAIAMAEHLLTKNIGTGKTVLEIGCGPGLPGIAAGKTGAYVTLTDYQPDALEMAESNWKLNNSTEAKFRLLDWRKPDASLAADLLLASDVAYEKKSFKALLHAFQALLRPGGLILLSEPGRKFTSPFFDMVTAAGYSCERHAYSIPLRGVTTDVGVYELRKS